MKIELKSPPKVEYELNLKLSYRELVALASICARVSGNPNGPRGVAQNIINCIEDSKVVRIPVKDPNQFETNQFMEPFVSWDLDLVKNGMAMIDKWPSEYKD